MDDQARAIGGRVRYWRTRRNLDRRRFADMVGRSTSWLDKVEKGERTLLRLPMLERVAEALNVSPSALIDSSAAQRAADCVDAVEVQAIRAALGCYPSVSARGTSRRSTTLKQLAGQLAYVDHAWLSSHFTVVSQYLPRLLADAQAVALTASPADQLAAYRVLVVAYRLASSMLLKFNTNDVAWLAADRAMHTALVVDDTLALARATRSVARAMTSTGQRADAIAALTGMADRMRPELPARGHELLSLYGMLFLAASITAAGQDDATLALAMHQEAATTADRMGPCHETHQTAVEYFVDVSALTELTGHPVRTTYRTADDESLPRADAVIVAPATYNTINKWAAGISDNYVLNQLAELTGLGAHIVVLPFINQGLAANRIFVRSVKELRLAGVRVLFGPGEFEPHPPRTGGKVLDSYPWGKALDAARG